VLGLIIPGVSLREALLEWSVLRSLFGKCISVVGVLGRGKSS